MGLEIGYFYSLTPRQFVNIQKGYANKKEQEMRLQMVLNRRLEFAIVAPYLDKAKKLTEQTWRPFDWEKETTNQPVERTFKSKAEMRALWDKIDKNKQHQ